MPCVPAYFLQLQPLPLEPKEHPISQTCHYLPTSTLSRVGSHAVDKGRVVLHGLLPKVLAQYLIHVPGLCVLRFHIFEVPMNEFVVKGSRVQAGVAIEPELEANIGMLILQSLL
jgi:hypothetical protein